MPRDTPMRSYMAGLAAKHLRACGHDAAAILAKHGIDASAESSVQVSMPLRTLVALYDEGAALTNDPLFGIHVGLAQRSHTLIDYLLLHSPTPRRYMQNLTRFAPLITTTVRWRVDDDDLIMEVPGEPNALGRHANECNVARVLLFLRLITGEHDACSRAFLAHHKHAASNEVEELFDVDVEWGCAKNGVTFRQDLLDRPNLVADPPLHDLLVTYAERELQQIDVAQPFVSRIRQRICAEISEHLPTLESVSAGLGLTPRFVQANLAKEGTSFAELLDSVRESLARDAIKRGTLSLWDVAVSLHYSDLSAFGRAFRRWTGTTPARYREQAHHPVADPPVARGSARAG